MANTIDKAIQKVIHSAGSRAAAGLHRGVWTPKDILNGLIEATGGMTSIKLFERATDKYVGMRIHCLHLTNGMDRTATHFDFAESSQELLEEFKRGKTDDFKRDWNGRITTCQACAVKVKTFLDGIGMTDLASTAEV